MLPSSFWRYSTTVLTPFASGPVICGAGAGLGGEGQPAAIAADGESGQIFFAATVEEHDARAVDGSRTCGGGRAISKSPSSSSSTESPQRILPTIFAVAASQACCEAARVKRAARAWRAARVVQVEELRSDRPL